MLKNLILLATVMAVMFGGGELFLRYREYRILASEIEWLKNTNILKLIGRTIEDRPNVWLFNGCIVDQKVCSEHALLGYVNTPNTQGFSIRVHGHQNLIAHETYDVKALEASGAKTEIARFRINNLGNRGIDMRPEKAPGSFRVVFVGDSVTFGFYVEDEETFVQHVGRRLPRLFPEAGAFEVVNAGVSSLNAHHILEHLKHRALAWEPDLVIWNFYANDIYDREGQEVDLFFPVRRSGNLDLLKHSAVGRMVEGVLFSTSIGASMTIDSGHPSNRAIEAAWASVAKDLQEAKRLLDSRGIPLVIVVFPSGIQFSRPWTLPHYQQRLQKICATLNLHCIDVLEPMKRAGGVADLYFGQDLIHPNPIGHAAAATCISDYLEANSTIIESRKPDRGEN